MKIPYHCLDSQRGVLFAASGPCLHSFSTQDGRLLSSWICPLPVKESQATQAQKDEKNGTVITQTTESPSAPIVGSPPPAKRRKLSDAGDEGKESKALEAPNKTQRGKQYPPSKAGEDAPSFAALTSTKDGKHVIAVTGEDKSIRVFEHNGKGQLVQLSLRAMPKRPCAIAVAANDDFIISADKFGDVYSLPLMVPEPSEGQGGSEPVSEIDSSTPVPELPFVSAANDLTVHSARNRRALKNQLRQNQRKPEKPEITFEHTLLLGHVSMLTELVLVGRNGRNYIVTADRDEHIRISRGIPQAHIIENYCLGHTEFITRLCFPTTHPNILISGGGDDELFVWEWLSGQLIDKIDIRSHVESVMSHQSQKPANIVPATTDSAENGVESSEPLQIAVSNLKFFQQDPNQQAGTVIVTCEGVPALFFFFLSADSKLVHGQTIELKGNPLDIAINDGVIVSLDGAHEAGSKTQLRSNTGSTFEELQVYQMKGSEWTKGNMRFTADTGKPEIEESSVQLSSLLYNLENLRKRSGEE